MSELTPEDIEEIKKAYAEDIEAFQRDVDNVIGDWERAIRRMDSE